MNYLYWLEISSFLNDIDRERQLFEKNIITLESMEATRKKMTSFVENIKSSLEQRLDRHHASLIVFAIVAGIDEKMQSYDYNTSKVRWAPLQKDFYAAYTAGEIFYKSLDEILEDPNIPNIVYQVYYTMLKRGFQGKYRDSKTQIAKYLDILKDKIPVPATIAKNTEAEVPEYKSKKSRLKKWHYYGLSFGCAGLTFLALLITAHFE